MKHEANPNRLYGQNKILWSLTLRHLKMFFKNKLAFFFSLLVPLITLVIYILFLRDLEFQSVDGVLKTYNLTGNELVIGQAHSLVDSWMLSGILAVSCITVSLNSCLIIITDRETGSNRDFVSSPISRSVINISYFLFNIIVTAIIIFVLLVVCLIYLGSVGSFYLSFANVMAVILCSIVSIISASLITVFVVSFVHSGAVFNSLIAIISASIGFLVGAYMPVSMLPDSVKYLCVFFPGTYSAGIFRNYFLQDQFIELMSVLRSTGVPDTTIIQMVKDLEANFTMNVSFFGHELDVPMMYLCLFVGILLFVILNLFFADRNLRAGLTGKRKRRKKKDALIVAKNNEETQIRQIDTSHIEK